MDDDGLTPGEIRQDLKRLDRQLAEFHQGMNGTPPATWPGEVQEDYTHLAEMRAILLTHPIDDGGTEG